jgi:hypothetical protein
MQASLFARFLDAALINQIDTYAGQSVRFFDQFAERIIVVAEYECGRVGPLRSWKNLGQL